jgi:hypothetical protein
MMRLLGLMLLVMTISASATAAARLIGGMRPSPLAVLATNPDGTACETPCIFGIRPGETNLERAITLLASHPLTRDFSVMYQKPFTIRGEPYDDILVQVDTNSAGLVEMVSLSAGFLKPSADLSTSPFLPQPAFFADVLGQYGAPDYVLIRLKGMPPVFTGGGLMIWFADDPHPSDHFAGTQALRMIQVFRAKNCASSESASINNHDGRLWLGFTTLQRYTSTRALPARFNIASRSYSVPCAK